MLAIGVWEKGASWRDRGWAGENADRSSGAVHLSQSAGGYTVQPMGKQTGRAHV